MRVTIHTVDAGNINEADITHALEDLGYYVESVEVLKR